MYTALEARVVIENFPLKITGIDAWDEKLIVGTFEGALLVLGEVDAPPTGIAARDKKKPAEKQRRFEVVESKKAFAKKPITQLIVLKQKRFLITLADYVSIHTLPDFTLVSSLTRTKGATLVTWDEDRSMLCVALRRRLVVYHYTGVEFAELKDLSLTESPRGLAWCGEALCIGSKKEYSLLNLNSGVLSEIFPTGRTGTVTILSLTPDELLLSKDNMGIYVGQDGKPTRRHGLPWSETPLDTASLNPYVLAILPRFIEVRALQRGAQHTLVQTIPLRDMKFICNPAATAQSSTRRAGPPAIQQGPVFIANESSIYRLSQVPLVQQIAQVGEMGEFEDALALCDILPADGPEPTASKDRMMKDLHCRYAYSLFASAEHTEAMRHFALSSVSPLQVLALFPSLLQGIHPIPFEIAPPPDGVSMTPSVEGPAYARSVTALLPYLLKSRQDVGQWSAAAASGAGPSAGEGRGPEARMLASVVDTAVLRAMIVPGAASEAAILGFLQGANAVDVKEGEAALLPARKHVHLVALYQSNALHRNALDLLVQLAVRPHELDPPPPHPSPFGADSIVDYLLGMGEASERDHSLVLEFAQWVLQADQSQGLRLLTSIRPPLDVEQMLPLVHRHSPALAMPYLEHELAVRGDSAPAHLHNELVMMYLEVVCRELHAEEGGEEAAADAGPGPDEGVAGPRAGPGQYSPTRLKLLNFLQGPPARYNPERMLSRFPLDALFEERALLLSRIKRHRSALSIYVHSLHSPKLAEEYCDRVYAQAVATPADDPAAGPDVEAVDGEGAGRDVYLALLQVYLEGATGSEGSAVAGSGLLGPSLLPPPGVDDADTSAAAGASKGPGGLSSIGASALASMRQLEAGGSGSKPGTPKGAGARSMVQEALGLLSRKHERIDGERALMLLPGTTSVSQLLPFLEGVLRGVSESRRNSAVVKSLRRYENLQVREAMIHCHQQAVHITTERACAMCHKRISNSVFAVYPDGQTLVHYNCIRSYTPPSGASIAPPTTGSAGPPPPPAAPSHPAPPTHFPPGPP